MKLPTSRFAAFLLFFLSFALIASADMKRLKINGYFTQAEGGLSFWNSQYEHDPESLPLALPIAFEFTCTYDDEAFDAEEEDSTFGIYWTWGGQTTLKFGDALDLGTGDFFFSSWNTEVRVYNGKNFSGLPFYGFGIGNEGEFEAYSLFVPAYFTYFACFQPFWALTTNDGLEQLELLEGNSYAGILNYVFIGGFNGLTEIALKTGSSVTYTIEDL